MKPNFILENGMYTVSKFSSGEVQVTTLVPPETYGTTITGSITSSDHIIELLQLVEAIRYNGVEDIALIMPYCAFSRQDRRCSDGESFSLKVFTNLINSCTFNSVVTYDNHSDVSTALIDNCYNIPVHELAGDYLDSAGNFYDFYVSPDTGANKKVFECSKVFNVPMLRADKSRDLQTGDITGTQVFTTASELDNKTLLIIDDICAGGRTFLELAKALKGIQPNVTIHLYVTHGFFDHGFEAMYGAGISKFITTSSVLDPAYQTNNFKHVEVISYE